jgi:small subunit ribosomal protein S20
MNVHKGIVGRQVVFGGSILANKRSAIKRNRQNKKRREHNRVYRGHARTSVKNARLAIEAGNIEEARENTKLAVKALDRAAAKGIIHKNNASRRKSRLIKQLSTLENSKS